MTANSYPTSLLTPRALCVLGMHRSGTSALAGMLRLLGVDLGVKLMAAGPDNPKGFWENDTLVGWHMGLLHVMGSCAEDFFPLPEGWERQPAIAPYFQHMFQFLRSEFSGKPLWGFKDPRACRLMPIWHILFSALGVEPGFILIVRNPDEVAVSMTGRGGFPYNHAMLSTLMHMIEAERHTRGRRRVVVTYDQVMGDWQGLARRIGGVLGVQWPRRPEMAAVEMRQFLDPGLRHYGAGQSAATADQAAAARGADPYIARCAYAAYQALATAAVTGRPADHGVMDGIAAEFGRAAPALRAWRPVRVGAIAGVGAPAHV